MKKVTTIIHHFSRPIFFFVNILVIIWLLLCKLASIYDPAGAPSIISLFSFSTIFALIANVFFVFYWLISKKKIRSLYSIITIVLMWSMVRPLISFNYFGLNNLDVKDGDVMIMTWNVHMFDLGAWAKDNAAKAKIINLINEENPDILCLEEFYWHNENNSRPYTDVIRNLGYPYVAFSKHTTMLKSRMTIHTAKGAKIDIGNIIFSKYPLHNIKNYPLGIANNSMLSVDVQIDSSHQISLNVVHLTSVKFSKKEMSFIKEVKDKGLNQDNAGKSKSLLKKLTFACSQRAILANHIDSLKRFMDNPIVICGDFNDVPSSYVYEKVKGELQDPFIEKGKGFGRTYQNIFPTLRIDYILYDGKVFDIIGYGRRKEDLSDHYPVMVNLTFKNEKIP